MSGEVATSGPASPPGWKTFTGNHVTLHVQDNDCAITSAPEQLRQADVLLEALKRLLSVNNDAGRVRIHLCLAESTGADGDAPGNDPFTGTAGPVPDGESI